MDSQFHSFANVQDSEQDNNVGVSQKTSKRPPRGPSFNPDEDQLLVSAWLNTGLDPIIGNDQSSQTFWGRIHNYYHKYKNFDSDRSQLMLSQRWGKVQLRVNKFSGCVASVNRRHESGKTESDKLADAKQMYEAQEKSKFNLDHAWILLRHQPKWIQLNEELNSKVPSKKKSKPQMPSSNPHIPTSSVADLEEEINIYDPMSRPPGKKAEKRKLKETSDQIELIQKLHVEKKERDEKKLAIMKEKLEVDKEKLRVRKTEADNRKFEAEMRIMSMDTSLMNPEQRAYYSKMQMKILQGE